VKVLTKEELCTRFTITPDERHRDKMVSAMCAELAGLQRREGRTCLLCIDELPPNTKEGKADSCDWTRLDTHSIACVLCLQPEADSTFSAQAVSVTPPASLDLVTLRRVIRCTIPILSLLTWLMEQQAGGHSPVIPTGDIRPGHEINGALPQVILHRQPCACTDWCKDPVPHHLAPLSVPLTSSRLRTRTPASPGTPATSCLSQARDWAPSLSGSMMTRSPAGPAVAARRARRERRAGRSGTRWWGTGSLHQEPVQAHGCLCRIACGRAPLIS
jgi:hypothetical protein